MPGYVCAALHYFQHENPKIGPDSSYPWTPPQYGKKNQILNDKHPAYKLDVINQKGLQKIVGKFLYYTQEIDSIMLMEINHLAAVQKKLTAETAK